MHHTYFLGLIFGAASTLAAPSASRGGLIGRQDSSFSSHTVSGIADAAHITTDADLVLPPPAEVFALMATATAATIQPPSPLITVSATGPTFHLGPGLVVSPTVAHIEVTSTPTSSEKNDATHPPSILEHKSIFISAVVLSMMALILAIYACSYHSHHRRLQVAEG
ncbi:hypothetical protein B0H10DRAFT_2140142, partial [Mycena sp. CBHHK59/15]